MILSDLQECKKLLDIDPENTSEDVKLSIYLECATNWVETFLNRKLTRKERTEYYKGTGTQKLLLRVRPVFLPLSVYVDTQNGNWGQSSDSFASTTLLTYGSDYVLQVDDENGDRSQCGILIRLKGYWPKPYARVTGLLSPFINFDPGSVKVVYTAGYTIDTLPAAIRLACDSLVAAYRYVFPLGMVLDNESYEERSIRTHIEKARDYCFMVAKPLLLPYRNWNF